MQTKRAAGCHPTAYIFVARTSLPTPSYNGGRHLQTRGVPSARAKVLSCLVVGRPTQAPRCPTCLGELFLYQFCQPVLNGLLHFFKVLGANWAAFTFLEGPDGCDQRRLPTPMLRATSSKRCTLSDSYHSVIESKNSCFRSSACAARGDNLVTRCCGNVPATS